MNIGDFTPDRIFYATAMHFIDPGSVRENLLELMKNNGITTSVLEHFESLRENSDKVKYAIRLLDDHHLILNDVGRNPKSDGISTKLRKSGNQRYAAKEYFNALELYNQSICFAEKGSENLSIGFANRSAVYFAWQLYEKCLENIRLAQETNYPVRLMSKLEKRQTDCEERINAEMSDDVEAVVPKLSYPAHANNPFMAKCVELKENAASGRHIVAKRNLKIGDIVILEKPFEKRLRYQYRYQRCTHCLIENEMSLIPCSDCTSAMYCSTQCLKTAYEKFHKYECPIVDIMSKLKGENALYAARVLLTMMHEYGGIEALATAVREFAEDDSVSTLKTLHNAAGIDTKGMYNFFHLLKHNNEKRINMEIFQSAVLVGVLYDLFKERTELKDLLANRDHENIFLNLLLKYFCICMCNLQAVTLQKRGDDEDIQEVELGSTIFPLSNMVNHSCYANVDRNVNAMSQLVMMVSRPIKKGEQLLCNSGLSHLHWTKNDRMLKLIEKYKFICYCVACTNEYPLANDLPIHASIPYTIRMDDVDESRVLDPKEAMDNLIKCKAYLEKYCRYYPCLQVYAGHWVWARSFRHYYGTISMDTKE